MPGYGVVFGRDRGGSGGGGGAGASAGGGGIDDDFTADDGQDRGHYRKRLPLLSFVTKEAFRLTASHVPAQGRLTQKFAACCLHKNHCSEDDSRQNKSKAKWRIDQAGASDKLAAAMWYPFGPASGTARSHASSGCPGPRTT